MSELDELYQEVILDHNRSPRNFRVMEDCNHSSEGYNPLCGDRITVYARVKDGRIEDLSFQGSGCAISKASASVMTTLLKGRTLEEAGVFFDRFHDLVTLDDEPLDLESLGELAALAGVREFPTRVKCATLAWHTLKASLESDETRVSTE